MEAMAMDPGGVPAAPNLIAPAPPMSAGGILSMKSNAVLEAEAKKAAEEVNNTPMIQGLAAYVRKCWSAAYTARQAYNEDFYKAIRQRRGEYDPDKLAEIRKTGGSEVYMNLTSVKCRGAASWLRDTLMGVKNEKPWTLSPTPVPEAPPEVNQQAAQIGIQQFGQAVAAGQVPNTQQAAVAVLYQARDQIMAGVKEEAVKRIERMEAKMEDQLIEGGWLHALDDAIEDIVTFDFACIKGPVVKKKRVLTWTPDPKNPAVSTPTTVEKNLPTWVRVDPMRLYPAPHSDGPNNGFLFEHHLMYRSTLETLKGVDGYKNDAINAVLEEYGRGGLTEWMTNESAKNAAEGKVTGALLMSPEKPIDALQFWGNVSGEMLRDWGMEESEVPDKSKEYSVEVWLIGHWVIKAVINPDPLARKPYYVAAYENIPGSFRGRGIPRLIKDCQDQVNTAARALANNNALSSGPQVAINVDRLPAGEQITQVFPWKIWQVTSDPFSGSTAQPPVTFFQPASNAAELMAIIEKFSQAADEYSGVPRYMTGNEGTPGAGRTASGLSMMIGNAGKGLKQVVSNIDVNIITPLLENLYNYNMQFETDPDLKGDAQIVARGATQLMVKEQTLVRMIEFLAQTANPIDMQIIGLPGRATVLRELTKKLDLNTDKIVPPDNVIMQRAMLMMMLQGQQQAQQAQGGNPKKPKVGSGQQLEDGTETTDNFQPT